MCKACCYDIILLELFTSFSMILWLVIITVTMSSDVTDVWQCNHDITLTLTLSLKRKINQKENKNEIFNEKISI